MRETTEGGGRPPLEDRVRRLFNIERANDDGDVDGGGAAADEWLFTKPSYMRDTFSSLSKRRDKLPPRPLSRASTVASGSWTYRSVNSPSVALSRCASCDRRLRLDRLYSCESARGSRGNSGSLTHRNIGNSSKSHHKRSGSQTYRCIALTPKAGTQRQNTNKSVFDSAYSDAYSDVESNGSDVVIPAIETAVPRVGQQVQMADEPVGSGELNSFGSAETQSVKQLSKLGCSELKSETCLPESVDIAPVVLSDGIDEDSVGDDCCSNPEEETTASGNPIDFVELVKDSMDFVEDTVESSVASSTESSVEIDQSRNPNGDVSVLGKQDSMALDDGYIEDPVDHDWPDESTDKFATSGDVDNARTKQESVPIHVDMQIGTKIDDEDINFPNGVISWADELDHASVTDDSITDSVQQGSSIGSMEEFAAFDDVDPVRPRQELVSIQINMHADTEPSDDNFHSPSGDIPWAGRQSFMELADTSSKDSIKRGLSAESKEEWGSCTDFEPVKVGHNVVWCSADSKEECISCSDTDPGKTRQDTVWCSVGSKEEWDSFVVMDPVCTGEDMMLHSAESKDEWLSCNDMDPMSTGQEIVSPGIDTHSEIERSKDAFHSFDEDICWREDHWGNDRYLQDANVFNMKKANKSPVSVSSKEQQSPLKNEMDSSNNFTSSENKYSASGAYILRHLQKTGSEDFQEEQVSTKEHRPCSEAHVPQPKTLEYDSRLSDKFKRAISQQDASMTTQQVPNSNNNYVQELMQAPPEGALSMNEDRSLSRSPQKKPHVWFRLLLGVGGVVIGIIVQHQLAFRNK